MLLPNPRLVLLGSILMILVGCGSGSSNGKSQPPGGGSTTPPRTYGAEFTVSPAGSDANAGTPEKPFKTLEKARDEVRQLIASGLPKGGIAVWIRGGIYECAATLELDAQDSGASAADSVDWRGYAGEQARLAGGRKLDPAWFTTVTSASSIWSRLDASAQGQVLQVDLTAHGITDFGDATNVRGYGGRSGSALELFINQAPMTLARWPDASLTEPPQDILGDSVQVFGSATPDVTGTYTKTGVQDGVSAFARSGLVGGLHYNLYRYTWDYQGSTYTAWFITTDASGYPGNTNPWWYCYRAAFGTFSPQTDAGAQGQPSLFDPARINHGFATLVDPVSDTRFSYAGDRPSRWGQAPDVWVHGYWKYAWSDQHFPASVDVTNRVITLPSAPSYGVQAGQPWYAYNLLEEITEPGEWYLDRTSGILYLWPPAGFGTSSEILVSMLEGPLIRLNQASHIVLQDLTLEATRQNLVSIQGGDSDTLQGLVLRNAGASGADVSGSSHLVSHCTVQGTANGGISLNGGDRPTLTNGNLRVEDCEIHHFARIRRTYQPAVNVAGCGNAVRNNLMHDAPHTAILWGGNEHIIELNEIHDVCQASSDAGVIYAGRDWGARGNIIRYNFIHHIDTYLEGYGVHGIYLDDCLSGVRVEGNVLYAISGNGIQAGGGRDNIMVNNLIIKSGTGIAADSRGYDWLKNGMPNNTPGDSWNLLEKLEQLGYKQQPWASRYPACAAIPGDWNAIIAPTATWLYPEGSIFSRNLGWQNTTWINASAGAQAHYQEMANNIADQDPLFVDEAHLDLTLHAGSPALAIPGFQAIPFKQIGIRK